MQKFDTKMLVTAAILVAMAIILSRFCSINAWNIKIGFTFVPIVVAAYLYGPVVAGFVAGVADLLGALLFPIGPYFPGFTLTAVLSGILFGILLHKKQTVVRIIAAVSINQLVLGLLVNTFWISILYGSPFSALFAVRIVQCAVLLPVEFVVISAICKVFSKYGSRVLIGS
ncbi:MAG: folate family ECF transporter S component [Bacillota bacterium]|nr:folate family ECF transporter S component [Bacillota bacterium]